MARVDVIMPQMGESIAEGTVSRWLKKVGDPIKRDEALFEISTDKVDAEIPSPVAGILAEIIVGEGTTVGINTVVARLETDASVPLGAAAPAPAATPEATPAATPAKVVAPTAITASTSAPAKAQAAGAPAGSFEERVRTKSSPLVRKIAAEHGVEITGMEGSGVAGRVTRRDIEAFLADRPATPPASNGGGMSMHAPAGTDSHGPMPTAWAGDRVEAMSKIRRLTSEHMTAARRQAAHVTTFFEIDLTRMSRVRASIRKDFEVQSGQKLTALPFILQAVAKQLKRHAVLNAAVAGNDIIYRSSVNIGIAVALDPTGLIVPVIKRADELSLTGLSRGVNDLAQRARAKKLSPNEVQDATFTVTNPGVFGSLMGTPIIPVGTTAILGLGAIEKRPKVITGPDGEDTIAIRTCAYFSLSFDHRVVDGADADRFMVDLKQSLETIPETGF